MISIFVCSFSSSKFGNFLTDCKRYGKAVLYIIKAMMQLHKSLAEEPGLFPDFDNPRFETLCRTLETSYELYSPRLVSNWLIGCGSGCAIYIKQQAQPISKTGV